MSTNTQSFAGQQTMTVTNLHSLANSATAGWQSDGIDFAGAFGVLFEITIAYANTAPGSSKAVLPFLASGQGSTYTSPATGTQGTITIPDFTANSLGFRSLEALPYTTQNETRTYHVLVTDLPAKGSLVLINHSGAALAASGNSVKYSLITYANA